MPTYRDQAVVLRTHKLGEADRIVSMLSREHGKIRAVARGIRRTSSKFGARLDPFNLVDLQLVQGRNLDVVAQVECLHPYSACRWTVNRPRHNTDCWQELCGCSARGRRTAHGHPRWCWTLTCCALFQHPDMPRIWSTASGVGHLVHTQDSRRAWGVWCASIVSHPGPRIRTRRRFRTCGPCWSGTGLRPAMSCGPGFVRGLGW